MKHKNKPCYNSDIKQVKNMVKMKNILSFYKFYNIWLHFMLC